MYFYSILIFWLIIGFFGAYSQAVFSMDQDPTEGFRSSRSFISSQKVLLPDLDYVSVDEQFNHFFEVLNTKIEASQDNLATLVFLHREALDLVSKYRKKGSQIALSQKPILQHTLALRLHDLPQEDPLVSRINSLRECCLLLKASYTAEYLPAKMSYAMALFETAILIDQLLEEDQNLTPLQQSHLQQEIISSLELSRKLLPPETETQSGIHIGLHSLLGLTLFKYAFFHRDELTDAVIRRYSLRARKVLTEAYNFHHDEMSFDTLETTLESVNKFLGAKYGII